MFEDFNIILPLKIREKIQYFVDKADKEISGLGDAWLNLEAKTITITSAFLLDQVCTASSTDLDEGAVAKAMFEAHQDEQKGMNRNIKFWWHSHVNMNVFWSGTDTATMKELSEQGWFSHIVFNKKREMLGAISYPVEMHALGLVKKSIQYTSEIPILVPSVFTNEEIEVMDKEMDQKYKEKTYTPTTSHVGGYAGHSGTVYRSAEKAKEYYEGIYGPGFADLFDLDDDEEYEAGEILPDGSIALHWEKNFKVVCWEGRGNDIDTVFFKTRSSQGWRPIAEDAIMVSEYNLEKLNLEAIQAIYLELMDLDIFPLKTKEVERLYAKRCKEAAEAEEETVGEVNGNKKGGSLGSISLPN